MASKRVGEDWIPPLPEYAKSLPPLPPVRTLTPDDYVGPTEESNWVIYTRMLVGAYPASVHDEVNTRILTGILKLGLTTFVCLQQEYQHEGVKEIEWRSGHKLRPYIFDAIKLVDALPPTFFPTGRKPDGLEFIHFPIQDCSIANDASVLQLCTDLVARMVRGENMYIHCLAEDHQILTNRGFKFLHELECNADPDPRIAGYDTQSKTLIYESCERLVVKPSRRQPMVLFDNSLRLTAARDQDTASGRAGGGACDGISLLVTPDHDMYATSCCARCVAAPSDSIESVRRACPCSAFAKVPALSLHARRNTAQQFEMLAHAANGVAMDANAYNNMVGDLALKDASHVLPFLELFGFWRARHSLGGSSPSGPHLPDGLTGLRRTERAWVLEQLGRLGLRSGDEFVCDISPACAGLGDDKMHVHPCAACTLAMQSTCEAMPHWVWNLPKREARAVLSGLARGARLPLTDALCALAVSSLQRDEIIRLALHAGCAATCKPAVVMTASGDAHPHQGWHVRCETSDDACRPRFRSSRDTRMQTYTGRTWCVSVPHGLIVARRVQVDETGSVTRVSQPLITGNCWGGHGRTGTVVSIMLGLMYGLAPLDAMRWVQFCHDLRIAPMGVPSPQTEPQRQQVIRILNAVRHAAAASAKAAAPRAALLSPQPSVPAGGELVKRTAGAATRGASPPNSPKSPPARGKSVPASQPTRGSAAAPSAPHAMPASAQGETASTPRTGAQKELTLSTPPTAIPETALTSPGQRITGTGKVSRPLAAPVTPASLAATAQSGRGEPTPGFQVTPAPSAAAREPTNGVSAAVHTPKASTAPHLAPQALSTAVPQAGAADSTQQRPVTASAATTSGANAVPAALLRVPSSYTVVIPGSVLATSAATPTVGAGAIAAPVTESSSQQSMAVLTNMPTSLASASSAAPSRPSSAAPALSSGDVLPRGPSIAQLVASALGPSASSKALGLPPSPSNKVSQGPAQSAASTMEPSFAQQLAAALDLATVNAAEAAALGSALAAAAAQSASRSNLRAIDEPTAPIATRSSTRLGLPTAAAAPLPESAGPAHVDDEYTPRTVDGAHIGLHSQSYVLPQAPKTARSTPRSTTPVTDRSLQESDQLPKPMAHASPRPASSMSLTEIPSIEAVLRDPVATSVDPLAASAASVLGLGPLVASRSQLPHAAAPLSRSSSHTRQAVPGVAQEDAGRPASRAKPVATSAVEPAMTAVMNPIAVAAASADGQALPTITVSLGNTASPVPPAAHSVSAAQPIKQDDVVAGTMVTPRGGTDAALDTARRPGASGAAQQPMSAAQRISQPFSSVVPSASPYTSNANHSGAVLNGSRLAPSRPNSGVNRSGSVPTRVRMGVASAGTAPSARHATPALAAAVPPTRPGSSSTRGIAAAPNGQATAAYHGSSRPASRTAVAVTAAASAYAPSTAGRSGSVPKSTITSRRGPSLEGAAAGAAAAAAAAAAVAASVHAAAARTAPRGGTEHSDAAVSAAARAGLLRPRVTVHTRNISGGAPTTLSSPDSAIAAAAAAAGAKSSTSFSASIHAAATQARSAAATRGAMSTVTATSPSSGAFSSSVLSPPMTPQPPSNAPTPRQRTRFAIASTSRGVTASSTATSDAASYGNAYGSAPGFSGATSGSTAARPPSSPATPGASSRLTMPLTAAALGAGAASSPAIRQASTHAGHGTGGAPLRLTEQHIMEMVAALPALASSSGPAPAHASAPTAALKELMASLQRGPLSPGTRR